MFSRGRKGTSWMSNTRICRFDKIMVQGGLVRDRIAFLIGSFFKPFDARFSELMKRMKTHQDLFTSELYVEDQEELMYQFREFEKTIGQDDQRFIAERLQEKLKNEHEYDRLAGKQPQGHRTTIPDGKSNSLKTFAITRMAWS